MDEADEDFSYLDTGQIERREEKCRREIYKKLLAS